MVVRRSCPSRVSRCLFQIRPLASTDYNRGHLKVLSALTIVTDPGLEAWQAQFETLRAARNTYYSIVVVDTRTDVIAAVGTLFVEHKFLRGLGSVGHIEDIAVDPAVQGRKLGLRVIQTLTGISENSGCYKTILNCNDKNIRASSFIRSCHEEFTDAVDVQPSTRNAVSRRKRTRWCVSCSYRFQLMSDSRVQQAKYAEPDHVRNPRL